MFALLFFVCWCCSCRCVVDVVLVVIIAILIINVFSEQIRERRRNKSLSFVRSFIRSFVRLTRQLKLCKRCSFRIHPSAFIASFHRRLQYLAPPSYTHTHILSWSDCLSVRLTGYKIRKTSKKSFLNICLVELIFAFAVIRLDTGWLFPRKELLFLSCWYYHSHCRRSSCLHLLYSALYFGAWGFRCMIRCHLFRSPNPHREDTRRSANDDCSQMEEFSRFRVLAWCRAPWCLFVHLFACLNFLQFQFAFANIPALLYFVRKTKKEQSRLWNWTEEDGSGSEWLSKALVLADVLYTHPNAATRKPEQILGEVLVHGCI